MIFGWAGFCLKPHSAWQRCALVDDKVSLQALLSGILAPDAAIIGHTFL